MDIQAIQDAIDVLENSNTTMENVNELSKLYIVRNNLSRVQKSSHSTAKILSKYEMYVDTKRQYQMRQISEDAVIASIKDVCKEIDEFISLIYSNSDLRKERKCLRDCINRLSAKCDK